MIRWFPSESLSRGSQTLQFSLWSLPCSMTRLSPFPASAYLRVYSPTPTFFSTGVIIYRLLPFSLAHFKRFEYTRRRAIHNPN